MKPKILTWNVQGLGAPVKRTAVNYIITSSRANIIRLQETKKEEFTEVEILEICGSRCFSWNFLPSIGASGEILCLWEAQDFDVTGVKVSMLFR